MDLPLEIYQLISTFLNFNNNMNLRLTCKTLYDGIQIYYFNDIIVNAMMLKIIPVTKYPHLKYYYNDDNATTDFYCIDNKNNVIKAVKLSNIIDLLNGTINVQDIANFFLKFNKNYYKTISLYNTFTYFDKNECLWKYMPIGNHLILDHINNFFTTTIKKYKYSLFFMDQNNIDTISLDIFLSKLLKKLSTVSFMKNVIKEIWYECDRFINHKFDTHINTINVKNGIIDLNDGSIKERTINDHCTFYTNIIYHGITYNTEDFDRYIQRLFNDDPKNVNKLQKLLISAIRGTPLNKIILFTGTGCNGISTFIYLLRKLLGNYFGLLDSFAHTELKNKKILYYEDHNNNLKIIKKIIECVKVDKITYTSSDIIPRTRRFNYIINCDNTILDKIKNYCEIIEFPVTFNNETANNNMYKYMKQYLDQFLIWIIKGGL
jgi:hypothetical protein